MRILGIDPGTATTGWGLIQNDKQNNEYVAVGTILTLAQTPMPQRLQTIYSDLVTLLTQYQPDCVVLEELFFNTNTKTALSVGQARGVVILAAVQHELPIFSYTPLQVKLAVAGYGRAEKKQMQEMVKTLLRLDKIPQPDDAADALAVALTHAYSARLVSVQQKTVRR